MNNILRILVIPILFLFLATSCGSTGMQAGEPSSSQCSPDKITWDNQRKASRSRAYVDGEVLIKFKDGTARKTIDGIADIFKLETERVVTPPNLFLMKILDGSSVEEMVDRLNRCDQIQYAEPNYIRTTD